jgi:hypothetical protein
LGSLFASSFPLVHLFDITGLFLSIVGLNKIKKTLINTQVRDLRGSELYWFHYIILFVLGYLLAFAGAI